MALSCGITWVLVLSALIPGMASAAPCETRIPINNGKASFGDVSAAICRELDVRPVVRLPLGRIDLQGPKGTVFVSAVNESLGGGVQVTLTPDALVLRVDPKRLPKDVSSVRRALRALTAVEAPQATVALQRHYGLHLPPSIDPERPLVVLIHGLDCDCNIWASLADLLTRDGRQVATFGYPSDGPIEEDSNRLAACLIDLRHSCPSMRVDIIAHSMGGLVARDYIEGADYIGGVDRLIMLGTPNGGSSWARWRLPLGVQEQFHLWRTDPAWSASWIISDGLGEAGKELMPGSTYLNRLNARRRQAGVRYTIVAGDRCPVSEIGADWFARTSNCLPRFSTQWWGLRQCKACVDRQVERLHDRRGDSDGPVTLKSAALAGVSDFVVVPADHVGLAFGDPPAAWDVIRDRLTR
jgi:pimeloyl-ACP methyl ester carboxylesterase